MQYIKNAIFLNCKKFRTFFLFLHPYTWSYLSSVIIVLTMYKYEISLFKKSVAGNVGIRENLSTRRSGRNWRRSEKVSYEQNYNNLRLPRTCLRFHAVITVGTLYKHQHVLKLVLNIHLYAAKVEILQKLYSIRNWKYTYKFENKI